MEAGEPENKHKEGKFRLLVWVFRKGRGDGRLIFQY
jgi:hypothetical protein